MSGMAHLKSREVWEFGDFQTPASLAAQVCAVLRRTGIAPSYILEPTCGGGAFIGAAATAFPTARLIGVDINARHVATARERVAAHVESRQIELREGDFFKLDWEAVLGSSTAPWLILGNPPWVTSADLGAMASGNLPAKSNVDGRRGIDALTGKSNFDISEWMLRRYLDWLRQRGGWIAVLVKSVVARKLLAHVWRTGYPVKTAAIYPVDARAHFGAEVDACLFVLTIEPGTASTACSVFDSFSATTPSHTIGFHDQLLVADVDAYLHWRHLAGHDRQYVWRSGIKHDCAKIMELSLADGLYRNGLDELVEIEDMFLYPLLKSSDVAKGGRGRDRVLLVTQRTPGEDTASIRLIAPRTWTYLQRHASLLAGRGSSIYRNRPPFSIFGVGDYSFTPWKIAISGFYKEFRFVPVGPVRGRPVVLRRHGVLPALQVPRGSQVLSRSPQCSASTGVL